MLRHLFVIFVTLSSLGHLLEITDGQCSLLAVENDDVLEYRCRQFKNGVVNSSTFENMLRLGTQHKVNVYVNGTNISHLQSDSFKSVREMLYMLHLSHNNLTKIFNKTFDKQKRLILLDMSYNFLRELSNRTFRDLVSLKFLFLNGNHLTQFFWTGTRHLLVFALNDALPFCESRNVTVTMTAINKSSIITIATTCGSVFIVLLLLFTVIIIKQKKQRRGRRNHPNRLSSLSFPSIILASPPTYVSLAEYEEPARFS
jgi:hypothetical protein